MQTLGERLEEARKRKGISIREAAEATKIRGDYLQKFEANTFDFDLPPLYVRGFLRTYVRFLELDAQRLVAEFDSLAADAGRTPRRETRENFGRVDFGGGEAAQSGGGGGIDPVTLKYSLFGGGAVVLALIIWLVVSLFTGSDPKPAPKQKVEAPPATTEQPVNLATAADSALTVVITEPTRVRVVYADNSVVFLDGKFPMAAGESRTFNYSKDIHIMVEHPERIRLEINGRAVDTPPNVKPMQYFRVPVVPRR